MDSFLLSILTCPKGCNTGLRIAADYGSAEDELLCSSCQSLYPVISGIPVLFPDESRRDFTIHKNLLVNLIKKVKNLEQKIRYENRDKYSSVFASPEVESLAWEYFFWQNWESSEEHGTISFDREKIREFLEEDIEGGGRRKFFELMTKAEGSLERKRVLNVGAGRDFLFEEVTEAGALVIEQDIVLDSLLSLRRRGAMGICCDLRSLPIKDCSVDIVTSFGTLHHIWPIGRPISEMARVLRCGGSFYINEPNGWAAPVLARKVLDVMPSWLRMIIVRRVMTLSLSPSP